MKTGFVSPSEKEFRIVFTQVTMCPICEFRISLTVGFIFTFRTGGI